MEEVSGVLEGQWERKLIEAARQGDAHAFGGLYDLHAERVYRHIVYRVGNRPDAEDLTQQTFLKAWKAVPRYKVTDASFIAWLLKIAHNTVISYFRSRREHSPLEALPVDPAEESQPHDELERRYHQALVRRAMTRLKPEQQQVVALRYLEEMSYEDIACLLGKSEANLRVILHRALKALHALLETAS